MFAIAILFAAMTHSAEGTLMTVDANASRIMANVSRQFETFDVTKGAVIRRGKDCIPLSDLTPGEFVRLDIDAAGRVTGVLAIVRIEPAKVRSVSGESIVLDDGRTFTVSSVLRFVGTDGKPSAKPAVKPGDRVLLFHHPQTGNVYRINAQRR